MNREKTMNSDWPIYQRKGRFPALVTLAIILVSTTLLCLETCEAQTTGTQESKLPVLEKDRLTGLSSQAVAQGWISLFDGKTLFGWRPESATQWRVENGTIVSDSGPVGLLRTTTQWDDFILMLDYRAEKGANSGIFLRTSPRPKSPASDCYELNIAPADNPFPTASFVNRLKVVSLDSEKLDDGDWHQYRVMFSRGVITVYLDGQFIHQYNDPNPLGRGYIGLQHREGKIEFRNIRLRPLMLKPMFNGENLDGWDTSQKKASEFRVTDDGEMEIMNGSGQIESELQLKDFYFQTGVKTNADGLNSGVFFRCIPGDPMNGYESQIQNAMKDNDPTKPADCGTGGIFRRVNARRIVANDQEWFYKTIVAEGPHFSVWVNGFQVTDWTDKRKPDPNPRRGLRRDAGTIIFQGHDPTTDILLKDIRSREMTVRRPKKIK